jgi:hypothetical protein
MPATEPVRFAGREWSRTDVPGHPEADRVRSAGRA